MIPALWEYDNLWRRRDGRKRRDSYRSEIR